MLLLSLYARILSDMNKYIFLLFLLITSLLSSCSIEKKEKFVIGVSQCSYDQWRHIANDEILREASFYPDLDVEIRSVKDDASEQIKDIEYFINKKVDLLVVSPAESTILTPIVTKAYKAGIPVILFDRKIDSEDYTAYVGADNYLLGYEAGLYIGGILKGKGNIVEVRGVKSVTAESERHNGFMNALAKFPDIKIQKELDGGFLRDVAEKEMLDYIRNSERIDLVFAMNDEMAKGVQQACSHFSGKRPFIVGVDALPSENAGIDWIRNGLIDASLIYPTGGEKVINVANDILRGNPYKKDNILYTAVVDKSNARVIQLQMNQIFEHQHRIDNVNNLLNKNIAQYTTQRTLFYATIFILLLITILLIGSFFAYRNKSRAKDLLEKQNKEISKQAKILEEQKEQLILLSQQLEEATQAKLVFFTNISHEFRTPLTLILGPVESLLLSLNLTEEERQLLLLVKRNSERLLNLISEIIEFRSYENGKMRLYLSENNLKTYIENLNILFSDYAKRKRIDFVFVSEEPTIDMWFDREKVEKIYFNLLSNAFKHANEGGTIKVTLGKTLLNNKYYAYLSVFNTGEAIPETELKRIFERFYKVNPHDTGTGIGLALTKALVEIHQGQIDVKSETGKGTTFSVLLPMDKIETEWVEEESKSLFSDNIFTQKMLEAEYSDIHSDNYTIMGTEEYFKEDAGKPIVLIVEDNNDMRNYMNLILNTDYEVIEADNGENGVEKALKYIPDVVISDVMMPGRNGFELCHYLKDNITTSHIPIILLTACTLDEQKAEGFESGADAYIPKPFNADILKIRLRKLIENRQKIKVAYGKSLVSETKKATLAEIEQDFIDKFKEYVENNLSDSDMSVDDIARNLGLSKSQLYRKIKSLTDYSPNELIRIIRLRYSRNLLKEPNVNIANVTYAVGFSSQSYFTKCFKEFFKENPTEYIARITKK